MRSRDHKAPLYVVFSESKNELSVVRSYACASSHIIGYFNTNLRIHQNILIVNQLHLVDIVRPFTVFL